MRVFYTGCYVPQTGDTYLVRVVSDDLFKARILTVEKLFEILAEGDILVSKNVIPRIETGDNFYTVLREEMGIIASISRAEEI